MTRDEHLMTIAMEECAEVAQRLSKAMRFGWSEVQPDEHDNPKRLTNRQRVLMEYIDLVAVMRMLGFLPIQEALLRPKQEQVTRFLAYSAKCGTLTAALEVPDEG